MTEKEDKINAQNYGWKRHTTTYPYTHPMFRVRQDHVRWPNGHEGPYSYIETPGAVWVVPVTPAGEIVLIRQFRYTVDDWIWEIPAGGFHDFDGSPVELAQRELAEEIGGSSDDWVYIGSFRPGVSTIYETCHIVLARNVHLDRQPHREPAEIIEIHPTPPGQALRMARDGTMVDGHSALALLRSEPYLNGGHP